VVTLKNRNALLLGRTAGILLGLGVLVFAGIMTQKASMYFPFPGAMHFLSTKGNEVIYNWVFQTAFYIHITSSCVVLALGIVQFFPSLLRFIRDKHHLIGKIYIIGILVLAAPSGAVLAYFANGGLVSKTGFMLQSVVWWLITWFAYTHARHRRWVLHGEWMVRSFAVTMAAISLRLTSYFMFYVLNTKPIETYLTVTWLSWVGNLVLAEILIQSGWIRLNQINKTILNNTNPTKQ
jgi:Predicted membrane protein (DUF2306)